MARTAIAMIAPGNVLIHQALRSVARPALIIAPHSGVGGCALAER
jgi:hypothetical protein